MVAAMVMVFGLLVFILGTGLNHGKIDLLGLLPAALAGALAGGVVVIVRRYTRWRR
jgi:hypothetical protein